MSTRREFIRDCCVIASTALVPAAVALPRMGQDISLAEISFETFAAQVNSRFMARISPGEVQPLKLVEATRGSTFAEHAGTETFSLLFSGDWRQPFGQGICEFNHARIGRFNMFIVPVGRRDADTCYYEAVFSRPSPGVTPSPALGTDPVLKAQIRYG